MLALIKDYLELVITILTSLGIILGLLAKLTKNKKLLKASNVLQTYKKLAEELVIEAETLETLSGDDKLKYVLSRFRIELNKLGIDFDEELAIQLVENIIKISKNVNFKE